MKEKVLQRCQQAVLDIDDRPSQPEVPSGIIQINPADADVTSGEEFRITCYISVSGFTLTWKKLNERLPAQAYQQAGTLVIPSANAIIFIFVCHQSDQIWRFFANLATF
jgi:hypothetical protein